MTALVLPLSPLGRWVIGTWSDMLTRCFGSVPVLEVEAEVKVGGLVVVSAGDVTTLEEGRSSVGCGSGEGRMAISNADLGLQMDVDVIRVWDYGYSNTCICMG